VYIRVSEYLRICVYKGSQNTKEYVYIRVSEYSRIDTFFPTYVYIYMRTTPCSRMHQTFLDVYFFFLDGYFFSHMYIYIYIHICARHHAVECIRLQSRTARYRMSESLRHSTV